MYAAAAFASDGDDYDETDADADEEGEEAADAEEANEAGGQAIDEDDLAGGFKEKVHIAPKRQLKKMITPTKRVPMVAKATNGPAWPMMMSSWAHGEGDSRHTLFATVPSGTNPKDLTAYVTEDGKKVKFSHLLIDSNSPACF